MARRGQAALEFLSTYGFAFLLILLMIAALSYFGILSPQKFLPGRCLISNEFRCDDRLLKLTSPTDLTMNLTITNQLGNTITFIPGATMVANSTYGNGLCTPSPAQITSGQSSAIECLLTGNFPAKGEKIKVGYTLIYRELGGSYDRVANGEVADTLQ